METRYKTWILSRLIGAAPFVVILVVCLWIASTQEPDDSIRTYHPRSRSMGSPYGLMPHGHPGSP